jgi:hypothetical protein
MGFQQGEALMYDPHVVISSKIITHGQAPYQHQQKTQLEMLANQNNWEDVQSILQIQGKTQSNLQNIQLQRPLNSLRKIYKRNNYRIILKNGQRLKKKD